MTQRCSYRIVDARCRDLRRVITNVEAKSVSDFNLVVRNGAHDGVLGGLVVGTRGEHPLDRYQSRPSLVGIRTLGARSFF